jgi:hypothetical protein
MQLRRFDERSYLKRKELFLVGLISVIVASSLGWGFFAILKSNQQVVATLSAQMPRQRTQTNSNAVATLTKEQPILADSLSQNTNNRWLENTRCVFQGGSYHILLSGPNQQGACGMTARTFSNVAIQVEMSLLSGQEAGLLFRVQFLGSKVKEYYYGLDHLHRIFFCVKDIQLTCPLPLRIIPGISIGQTNVLLALAQKNTISLYMNGIFVYQLQDSTSSSGFIGFNEGTDASTQSGNASFTHLKVYQA